jgi:hypothetical protein
VKLRLPNHLTEIGVAAFSGCSGLVELHLPDTLTEISNNAFLRCSRLAKLRLPKSLTAIGARSFLGCSGLVELHLPDTLAAIGTHAFYDCSGLVELHLPDTLTAIGGNAFSRCSGLVELHLPDTLTAIHTHAFYDCSGLVELHLPKSLTAIGSDTFSKCTNLRCLILPPALISLDATAFNVSKMDLRMLVVASTASADVATVVADMFSLDESEDVDFPIVANVQLVSAPDVVVASLGGVFAEMSTMTEVRAAGRAVSGRVEHFFWTVKTHLHRVCTCSQRECAHTLLLVGARLYSQSAPSSVIASDQSSQVAAREAVPQLPALPDDLWVLILGWLRRSELGCRR